MIFETIITDEGSGIAMERLPNLFKVFGELKYNLEIQESYEIKDNGIGVGLCCSKMIAQALHGDVIILPNQSNQTSVSITVPVKIWDFDRRNSDVS